MKLYLLLLLVSLLLMVTVACAKSKLSIYNTILAVIVIFIGYIFIDNQCNLVQSNEKIAYHLQRIADKETAFNSLAQESAERAMPDKELEKIKQIVAEHKK